MNLSANFLLIFYFICHASAHGNGAPSSRCESMLPGHWVSPQESLSPFQVIVDKTVIVPGDRVNITLSTIGKQQGFKGFLVMVKEGEGEEGLEGNDGGQDASKKGKNYGVFDLKTSDIKNAQPVHCFDERNSAMTHLSNDVKSKVELFWIAPSLSKDEMKGTEKELKVVVTFVKDFWTIWTNVEPVGGSRLLLTDNNHQFSPKFHQPQSGFRAGDTEVFVPSSGTDQGQEGSADGSGETGNNSWNNFKRAWGFVAGLFS